MITVFGLVLGTLTLMLRALVLKKLWMWFIIPQFGLSPLTYGTAMGLSLFVSILTVWKSFSIGEIKEMRGIEDKDHIDFLLTNSLVQAGVLLYIWGFSWLIHSFM